MPAFNPTMEPRRLPAYRLLPLVLLMLASFVHADVAKWVDSNGKVHYGDRPPTDGSQAKVVKTAPAASSSKSSAASAGSTKGKNVSEACGKVRFVDGFDPCNLPPGMTVIKGYGAEEDEARRQVQAGRR